MKSTSKENRHTVVFIDFFFIQNKKQTHLQFLQKKNLIIYLIFILFFYSVRVNQFEHNK